MRREQMRRFIRFLQVGLLLSLVLYTASAQAQSGADKSDEIVYIDSNGFIRVLDPYQSENSPVVQWRSPDGGWYDAALGDFNADGDAEIAAVGASVGPDGIETTRLAIFDPVVASGEVNSDQRINGIPWTTLYTETLPGPAENPFGIAVGKFSPDEVPSGVTDGIVIGAVLPDAGDDELTPSRVTLLSATSSDGRSWETRFTRDFRNEWALIRAGNINNTGLDEVVLVDEGLSSLAAYRINNGMSDEDRIFLNASESRKWNDAIVAASWEQMNQLIGARSVPIELPAFLIFQYQNADDEWIDLFGESFAPPPLRLFAADINASGDDEIFILRDVPSDNTVQPRLFMRHLGFDVVNPFEAMLDPDNGYKEGAGGDIYGDDGGKDEIVVIRDNFIRIYTEPELNQNFLLFGRTTNLRTVEVGDLDAIGFVPQPAFKASPDSLSETMAQDEVLGPLTIELTDVVSDTEIPFTYSIQGNPDWITVDASSDRTPATFQVYLDATKLQEGAYTTAIEIETDADDIVDPNLSIPIEVAVESGISVVPNIAVFLYESCDGNPGSRSQAIQVLGTAQEKITATIASSPSNPEPVDWAMAELHSDELPTVVTVTVDPQTRNADLEEAVLLLEEQKVGGSKQSVPIYLICANQLQYLPTIAK